MQNFGKRFIEGEKARNVETNTLLPGAKSRSSYPLIVQPLLVFQNRLHFFIFFCTHKHSSSVMVQAQFDQIQMMSQYQQS